MSTGASREPTPLCLADEATFWPWRTWTDFARLTAAEKAGTTAIVPVAGMADWGLGHALDAEEQVLMAVLKAAIAQRPAGFSPLVVPPLRFVLGPDAGCAFAVDPPTGHAFLREVAASINAAGFRRLVFFNASPWNEELCAAASRDLRIEYGLQIFRINLGALDLDFHPTRSRSRRRVQTLLTALTGRAPDETAPAAPPARPLWSDERVTPLPGPAVSVATAMAEGSAILAAAAARVSALFGEIAAHPALARDGALRVMTPP
jgi:creatinine amidohydrolase